MKRYTLTPYDDACADTQAVYDDYLSTTGMTDVPVWLQSLGHSPALVKGYWERAKGTIFAGDLPRPLKELLVYCVSAQNKSRYCSVCHSHAVLSLDKSIDISTLSVCDLENLAATLPSQVRVAMLFAIKVAADANTLTDDDFTALRSEGYGQEEICEMISVIDLAMMFNTYTCAMKLDLDPCYEALL